MKKRKASLTVQLVFTMIGIVAGTVILCWFFNRTFLEKYYIYKKEQDLLKGYQKVKEAYRETEITEDMAVALEKLCSDSNFNILLTDRNRVQVWSSYSSAQRFQMQMDDWIYGTERNKTQILRKGKKYILLKQSDERLQSEYLVLAGEVENGGIVYIRAALESIRESADVTNRFYFVVSIGAVVISIFLIIIISNRMTHPVRSLSEISKRMSELDFDAKFEQGKHGSREIDELGISMNELSETLEQTISELKTANNSLRQDIKKREQIDEMRKEFLSNVSHELKTPIALIQGYAEGLQECINEDAQSRNFYCEVITDEAEKMNHMVKQLLTLNQLEFGNDTVEMTRFDLTELIVGVINASSVLAARKQAEVRFCKDGPVYVWGDEFKVEEVITNYLTNAWNHVDEQKKITITCRKYDGKVRTSVFNSGKPIPEEDIDKIWTKFYKVDKARTREYGGSGIGLSIVKAIMDSFHQKCGVINHPDGVEFWMELESNN